MIYTVTLNPSLDCMLWLNTVTLGSVNRVEREEFYPGGKGINVSLVLSRLGIDTCALGFVAGFTGEELIRRLKKEQCRQEFIRLKTGQSRINVKLIPNKDAFLETNLNGLGAEISLEEMEQFNRKLDGLCDGDGLVLAGSIPKGLPQDTYEKILDRVSGKKILTVVDTSGQSLKRVLGKRPFLIKPNQQELEELFQTKLQTTQEIIIYAKRLLTEGARHVLVSLGEEGAILVSENGQVIERKAPKGMVVQTVGAGDSMVAGFLAGYLKNGDLESALNLAVAAGSATAFTDWLAKKEQILELLP